MFLPIAGRLEIDGLKDPFWTNPLYDSDPVTGDREATVTLKWPTHSDDLEKLVELPNWRLILWKLAKVCISCLMEALQRVQNESSRWAHVSWAAWKDNILPGGLHYRTWFLPDEAKFPLQHGRKRQHHRGHGGSFRARRCEMAEPNTSFKVAGSQRGAFLSSDPPCVLIQTAKLC